MMLQIAPLRSGLAAALEMASPEDALVSPPLTPSPPRSARQKSSKPSVTHSEKGPKKNAKPIPVPTPNKSARLPQRSHAPKATMELGDIISSPISPTEPSSTKRKRRPKKKNHAFSSIYSPNSSVQEEGSPNKNNWMSDSSPSCSPSQPICQAPALQTVSPAAFPSPTIPPPLAVLPRAFLYPQILDGNAEVTNGGFAKVIKRRWQFRERSSMDASYLSIMSWNVLAPSFEIFGLAQDQSPPSQIETAARMSKIIDEILFYEPDIVCLQEMDSTAFSAFTTTLGSAGYHGTFAPKSEFDGCAIFHRGERFVLEHTWVLRYRDISLDASPWSPKSHSLAVTMATRFIPFGNIAQLACFVNRQTGARFRIVNTHLLWQPEFADAKLLQAAILVEHLQSLDSFAHSVQAQSKRGRRASIPSIFPHRGFLKPLNDDSTKFGTSAPLTPSPLLVQAQHRSATPDVASTPLCTSSTISSNQEDDIFDNVTTVMIPSPSVCEYRGSPSPTPSTSTQSSKSKTPKIRSISIQSEGHFKAHSLGANIPIQPLGNTVATSAMPTIICGDLNSLDQSSVLDFLVKGSIPINEFGDSDFGRFTAPAPYPSGGPKHSSEHTLVHRLNLASAYHNSNLPYTHRRPHFSGVIDHILYTDQPKLKLVGRLDDVVDPRFLPSLPSLPTPHIPSDHLPLLAVFKCV